MSASEEELTVLARRRIGSVLRGKYRIDRVLGVGGMAVVYKVTHRNQAEFALKMLHPELSLREDVRNRFLREGYAANSVKHPGVVLVVDDDVAEDGAAFLVMELLHGLPIEGLWEHLHHRVPLHAVLSVADQVLEVLAAAHERGIVHRDIKPANLFATGDGTLKVLDFGIARVRDAAVSHPGLATGAGVLLGTPAFMAPEQAYAMASEIDGQTDVWAVGATLFTLLSGHPVHEGDNAAQLMIRAATTHARPLRSVVPDVPAVVAEVIDRALAFEKASRWPSAGAMRDAIEQATRAAFGAPPDKGALATLLPPGLAGTRSKPPARPASVPWSAPPEAAAAPPTGLTGGGTTAQPVASERGASSPPRDRTGVLVAAMTIGVVLIGGLVLLAELRGKTERAPAASATAAATTALVMTPPSEPVALSPPASLEPASPLPANRATPAPRTPPVLVAPRSSITTAAPAAGPAVSAARSLPPPQKSNPLDIPIK